MNDLMKNKMTINGFISSHLQCPINRDGNKGYIFFNTLY